MSDGPSETETLQCAEQQGSLAKFANGLKSIQGIPMTFVSFSLLWGLVAEGCNVPMFSRMWSAVGLVSAVVPPKPSKTEEDIAASYPELDAKWVHSFRFETPATEAKPGYRKWLRVAPDIWEQSNPDGMKEYFSVTCGHRGFAARF